MCVVMIHACNSECEFACIVYMYQCLWVCNWNCVSIGETVYAYGQDYCDSIWVSVHAYVCFHLHINEFACVCSMCCPSSLQLYQLTWKSEVMVLWIWFKQWICLKENLTCNVGFLITYKSTHPLLLKIQKNVTVEDCVDLLMVLN